MDLTNWELSDPTDLVVRRDDLLTKNDYFMTRYSDSSRITLRVPHGLLNAESVSSSPRCELRECDEFGVPYQWKFNTAKRHVLWAKMDIDAIQNLDNVIIIGQFHGKWYRVTQSPYSLTLDNVASPPIALKVRQSASGYKIQIAVYNNPRLESGTPVTQFSADLMDGLQLGDTIKYFMSMTESAMLTVDIQHGGQQYTWSHQLDAEAYKDVLFYAKCGVYSTVNTTGPDWGKGGRGKDTLSQVTLHYAGIRHYSE